MPQPQADRAGFARQHFQQFERLRGFDQLGHCGRGAHQVGGVDRRHAGDARAQLGRLNPAHVERARLHLLHHRRLVAQLARVEHGNAQAAIGFLLQRLTKLQRGAVPRVPGGCDQAEAQFLGRIGAHQRGKSQGRGGGKSGRRGLDELAAGSGHGRLRWWVRVAVEQAGHSSASRAT